MSHDRDDASSDPDRGSIRMQMASALLRDGGSLSDIAAQTGVPVALLELLRDEQQLSVRGGSRAFPPRPSGRRGGRLTLPMATVLVLEFVGFCNVALTVSALAGHHPIVGAAAGVGAVVSIGAAWLIISRWRASGNRPGRHLGW